MAEMVSVHLKISEEINKLRKSLNVSWRDLIMAGLKALKNPGPDPNILRPHLVAASKAIKAVDDLLKGNTI